MWEVAHAAGTNAGILHGLTGGSGSGLHFLRMRPDSIGRSVDIRLRGSGVVRRPVTRFTLLGKESQDSEPVCV